MGGYISSFMCNVVAFAYPTYASFKAIESEGKDDDTTWLIYWVVYSFFAVFESLADTLIFWIPFYYELKLLLVIAMQIPSLKLPLMMYQTYVRPFLKQHETQIDSAASEIGKEVGKKASEFAQEQAQKAFQAALSAGAGAGAGPKKDH